MPPFCKLKVTYRNHYRYNIDTRQCVIYFSKSRCYYQRKDEVLWRIAMFLDGLDKLDQEIVSLLIENARISYSDIGEKIGISRVAVKARIQALEQRGIIEEYTTIINPQKISGAVSCYFEIETTPNRLAKVTELLNANDTVTQIYRVTGKDKLHVHAVASSAEEMEAFLHTVIDPLPGVISCSCNMILSRIKDVKGLRL